MMSLSAFSSLRKIARYKNQIKSIDIYLQKDFEKTSILPFFASSLTTIKGVQMIISPIFIRMANK
jgi:hypothetical protein